MRNSCDCAVDTGRRKRSALLPPPSSRPPITCSKTARSMKISEPFTSIVGGPRRSAPPRQRPRRTRFFRRTKARGGYLMSSQFLYSRLNLSEVRRTYAFDLLIHELAYPTLTGALWNWITVSHHSQRKERPSQEVLESFLAPDLFL
jgi:hypothetical protein